MKAAVLLLAVPLLAAQDCAVIEGTASNKVTHAGIPGVAVKLAAPSAADKPLYSATSDASGAFRLDGVKDGGLPRLFLIAPRISGAAALATPRISRGRTFESPRYTPASRKFARPCRRCRTPSGAGGPRGALSGPLPGRRPDDYRLGRSISGGPASPRGLSIACQAGAGGNASGPPDQDSLVTARPRPRRRALAMGAHLFPERDRNFRGFDHRSARRRGADGI